MRTQEDDNVLENNTIREMIIRVDERTKSFQIQMDHLLSDIELMSGKFVTKERFDPVEKIVYGFVSLVLIAVVGTLITVVIKR